MTHATIDPKAARALVEPRIADALDYVDFEIGEAAEVHLYRGGVTLPPGYIGEVPILVDGDASVDGLLEDGDDPATLLVVLGDLRARSIFTQGTIVVAGDLIVEDAVYANSFNDLCLWVGGQVRTKIFAESGMRCIIGGELHADAVGSTHNSITYRANGSEIEVPSIPDLRGVFDPALLDDDGYADEDRLREAMRAGKKLSP